jgi:hypothetical protein
MARKGGRGPVKKLLGFVAWLTGIIVSLAVGFAMTGDTLSVPYLPPTVSVVAGWIVVVTALITVVLAIVNAFD